MTALTALVCGSSFTFVFVVVVRTGRTLGRERRVSISSTKRGGLGMGMEWNEIYGRKHSGVFRWGLIEICLVWSRVVESLRVKVTVKVV